MGAVTMKMISSTSITSTSGVTLMSPIGALLPPPELELNAIVLCPALSVRRRDEADLRDADVLCRLHHLRHEAVLGGLVGADVDARLRFLLGLDRQLGLEHGQGHALVVPV